MKEENRALAIRWFEKVWNERHEATIDEIMSPDAIGHMEGIEVRGRDGFKSVRASLLVAFPDLHINVDSTAAEEGSVVVRWTAAGTQSGRLLDINATNLRVAFRGMTWLHFEAGRLVEGWDSWNQGALTETLRTVAAAQILGRS